MEKLYRYTYEQGQTLQLVSDYRVVSNAKLTLEEYEVTGETMAAWRIADQYTTKGYRFVRKQGKNLFAYPTKERALEAVIARKKFHIRRLKSQLSYAEAVLQAANIELDSLKKVQPKKEYKFGVVVLLEFDEKKHEFKITGQTRMLDSMSATIAYGEIPNPPSQLLLFNTIQEFNERFDRLAVDVKDKRWVDSLLNCL